MNEFKVKNGLIVEGPLTASFAYTTASWALSASWAPDVTVTVDTASWASSSIQAKFATQSLFATQSVQAEFATQSLFATNSISASVAVTSSNLIGFNFVNTGSVLATPDEITAVYSASTGSYIAAFFDYAAVSESNVRAGTVFGSWVNGLITYSEVCNVDVGGTSTVTMSLGLVGDAVQLSSSVSTTPWVIKTLVRYI